MTEDVAWMDSATQPVPFSRALRSAMAVQGFTTRALSRATKEAGLRNGRGLSHAHIGALARGDEPATLDVMTAIASILDLDLAGVAEFRLWQARHKLDEREVGLTEALEALSHAEPALLSPEQARDEAERIAADFAEPPGDSTRRSDEDDARGDDRGTPQ